MGADLKGADANFTINIGEGEKNTIFFEIVDLVANSIDVTYSSFGDVNAILIREALNTLMW